MFIRLPPLPPAPTTREPLAWSSATDTAGNGDSG